MSDERHNSADGGMDDVLPVDLRPVDTRLASDSALWSTRLPSADRLAQQARELPARIPLAPTAQSATTPSRPAAPRWTDAHTRGQIPMTTTRLRTSITVAAAVAVVALLAVLFNALALSHSNVGSGGPGGTTTTHNNTSTTTTPAGQAPTPGPIVPAYVQPPVTARGVDAQGNPVHETTQFDVNSTVYVVIPIRGLPAGQHHTLTVHWSLDGQELTTKPDEASITRDGNVSFSLTYPTAGEGGAAIFLDGAQVAKAFFTVGTPSSSSTGSETPTPGPTPTPWPNPATATPGA